MIVKRLVIDNIRSYDHEEINFETGTLLIHGDNGAGKSTLLQSIFGGLYQTDMLDETGTDVTLDTLVNRDADEGSIQLTFEIGSHTYELNWVISITTDDDGERKGRSKTCTLSSSALPQPVDGVTDVGEKIVELLGMTPEAFVNSVYVQQGDITRLIHASGDERQKIIDGLLGLNKLDTYIERMKEARRELKSNRTDAKSRLSEKQDQKQQYPPKSEIQEKKRDAQSQQSSLESDIEDITEGIEQFKQRKDDLEEKLTEYDSLKQERDEAKRAYENAKDEHDKHSSAIQEARNKKKIIQTEIDETETAIQGNIDDLWVDIETADEVDTKLDSVRAQKENATEAVTKIREGKIKSITEKQSRTEDEISECESRIADITDKISSVKSQIANLDEKKEQKEDEISEIVDEIAELRSEISRICELLGIPTSADVDEIQDTYIPEKRDESTDSLKELYSKLGKEQHRHETYETLTDTGECPICEETHDTVSEAIEDNREDAEDAVQQLENQADEIENQQELVDQLSSLVQDLTQKQSTKDKEESKVSQIESQIDDKRTRVDELEEEKRLAETEQSELEEDKEDLQIQLASAKETLAEKEQTVEVIDTRLEKLNLIDEQFERKQSLEQKLSDAEQEIEHAQEMRRQVQDRMDEKERRLNEAKDEIQNIDVQEYRDERDDCETNIEKLETQKKRKQDTLSDVRDKIARLDQQQSQVEEIITRINELEARVEQANAQVNEATEAIGTYQSVKKQLRQENLDLLNRYANDVFKSFYRNQTYQQLRIAEDYSITLITSDGTEIEPELSSGGEGTVVNLSLRAGVYRLLTERNGSGDTLPPFILDEPTTFLDTDHISQLQNVIDTITDWNVPQVFVVSHDEGLIQNAGTAYHVEKDPATEKSNVTVQ